jgi:hypothetical protein
MTASDTATFFDRRYWTKQAFVVLLLANGYGLVVAERLARQARHEHGWRSDRPRVCSSGSCCCSGHTAHGGGVIKGFVVSQRFLSVNGGVRSQRPVHAGSIAARVPRSRLGGRAGGARRRRALGVGRVGGAAHDYLGHTGAANEHTCRFPPPMPSRSIARRRSFSSASTSGRWPSTWRAPREHGAAVAAGRRTVPVSRHGSKYQPDGTFISGRATRNMDRFAIRHEGDKLIVDVNRLYRSDQQKADWDSAVVTL